MYIPAAFAETDLPALHAHIRAAGLAILVSATADGPFATHLPLFLAADEGPYGTLYGHVARANPHAGLAANGPALVIFSGPDAYVSPSFYPSKQAHGRVVPTWNYAAVHAYGPAEFFAEEERLLRVVTTLTTLHEQDRPAPWAVSDAPADFIRAQLRAITGLRLPITRLEGKLKMSQNRTAPDRAGVAAALAGSPNAADRAVAALIPE